jgi:hypothetical protein
MLQPFASAFSGQFGAPTPTSAPASAPAQEAARLRQMIDDLQHQVQALKKVRAADRRPKGRKRV